MGESFKRSEDAEPKLPMPPEAPFGGLPPRLPLDPHAQHTTHHGQPQVISVAPAPVFIPQAAAYASASPTGGPPQGPGIAHGNGAPPSDPPPPKKPIRSRRVRRAVFACKAAGASVAALVIAVVALLGYYTVTYPNPLQAGGDKRSPVIQILARDGSLLAERGRPHDYIPLQLLPLHVTNAVLATEDRRFYKHWGIDPGGLTRAAFANLRAGRFVQGGSTITQQLAKNLFLSPERTIARKLEEISIALWLELRLTKKQILELYLNQVYFGAGAYGIEAAAQKYFDKSARALSIREAALIAGLLQAPTRYSPFRNPGLARRRGDAVIGKMHRAGFIDRATARTARSAKLKFAKADASGKSARQLGYAIDYVLAHLPQLSGLEQGIIIVETTIDAGLQRKAQTVLAQTLARARGGRRARGQGAIVVMDGEGGVRAIVGGRSYRQSQFNRAIKAQRQPGSAFKPFVFLAALQSGLTPDTTVYDLPVTIGNWSPRNASGKFEGAMALREGLSRSVNTVAVRLQQQLGAGAVMSAARKLGITSKLRRDPTLALGTSEVSTLEMTTAYAALANGGLKVAPHVISRVRTHSGRLLYAPSARTPRRVLDGKTVGAMSDMLSSVITTGTGRRAAIARHPAAGKTGTTQDARDAWFVGYTRHLTMGVWIGQDGRGPSLSGLSGGTMPARVWQKVMAHAHAELQPMPLAWYGGATPAAVGQKSTPERRLAPVARQRTPARPRSANPQPRPQVLARTRLPALPKRSPTRRPVRGPRPVQPRRVADTPVFLPALPKRTERVRNPQPVERLQPASPISERFIADAIRETERLETRRIARRQIERTRRARQFDAEAIRRMIANARPPAGQDAPAAPRRPRTMMGLGKRPSQAGNAR